MALSRQVLEHACLAFGAVILVVGAVRSRLTLRLQNGCDNTRENLCDATITRPANGAVARFLGSKPGAVSTRWTGLSLVARRSCRTIKTGRAGTRAGGRAQARTITKPSRRTGQRARRCEFRAESSSRALRAGKIRREVVISVTTVFRGIRRGMPSSLTPSWTGRMLEI